MPFHDVLTRPATPEDISHILELDRLGNLGRWSREMYRALMTDRSSEVTVATFGPQVAGFCAVSRVYPELEVLKIAVRPELQGKGIGQALLDGPLAKASREGYSSCFLEVRTSNSRAIRFYTRRGFEVVGVRRAYYREPIEDALVMRKELRRLTS